MSARERMTLAAGLAVALGCTALIPLYSDSHWLGRALLAVVTLTAVALAGRRAAVPLGLQPLVTTATLGLFTSIAFARDTLAYGILPTWQTRTALQALLSAGYDDIQRLAPPVPSTPGLTLIAVVGVGAVAVVVDLLAVTLGRAALAGLPLLALFAVPSAVLSDGIGWVPFALGAVGWLGMMLVEGNDRVGRWGAPPRGGRTDATLGRVGRRIGAAALGVAVFVPAVLPGLDARLLGGGGGGDGAGKGGRTTTTYNPITKLRDDLRRPRQQTILTYRTTASHPDYLRLTTLDVFNDAGWSSTPLVGAPEVDSVRNRLPAPVGLTSANVDTVVSDIRIDSLDAHWLPAPAVPTEVEVSGPWLYDARSETVFSISSSTQRLKRSYRVTSTRAAPTGALLAAESASGVAEPTVLPYAVNPRDKVTEPVVQLTERITAAAPTPYDKVVALQDFFTDRRHGFVYDTSSRVPGINSPSALEDFLTGKHGFCEQYASAMAAMMRIIGVPARVAVGFTAGTRQADGSYRVTTDDAHAWPEGWFAGSGWVRFEPTPRADGQTSVPAYTLETTGSNSGAVGPNGDPLLTSGSETAAQQKLALQNKLDQLDEQPPAAQAPAAAPAGGGRGPLLPLVLLALLLALTVPRALHVLRLRRRWRPGRATALAAWAQLRDDAADLGHAWRPADSPRVAAEHLARKYALTGPPRAALERLTAATERARFARVPGSAAEAPDDLAAVVAALRDGTGRGRRWRARLLPPSTLHWAADGVGSWWDRWRARLQAAVQGLRRRTGVA